MYKEQEKERVRSIIATMLKAGHDPEYIEASLYGKYSSTFSIDEISDMIHEELEKKRKSKLRP